MLLGPQRVPRWSKQWWGGPAGGTVIGNKEAAEMFKMPTLHKISLAQCCICLSSLRFLMKNLKFKLAKARVV